MQLREANCTEGQGAMREEEEHGGYQPGRGYTCIKVNSMNTLNHIGPLTQQVSIMS